VFFDKTNFELSQSFYFFPVGFVLDADNAFLELAILPCFAKPTIRDP